MLLIFWCSFLERSLFQFLNHDTTADYCYCIQVRPGVLNGATATAMGHHVLVQPSLPWKVSRRTVRCTSCDITLNSQQQARQHFNGKAHQRRLQKLQQQPQKDHQRISNTIRSTYNNDVSHQWRCDRSKKGRGHLPPP